MTITVRRAVEADGPALVELRRTLFAETDYLLYAPSDFKQTPEGESARIERLNARPNCLVALAEDGTDIVGTLTALGGDVPRLAHSATLALGVRRSHWGKGAGALLLEFARSWSRDAALHRLELTVHTDNLRALGLYMRFGFRVEGVRRDSLYVSGRYVDEYTMAVLSAG